MITKEIKEELLEALEQQFSKWVSDGVHCDKKLGNLKNSIDKIKKDKFNFRMAK
ncbi:TPA: hypothetical protein RFV54_003712, partial [Klebsiella aerogenes]|nr:hypothetical protein [Klebsiella aerogenes]